MPNNKTQQLLPISNPRELPAGKEFRLIQVHNETALGEYSERRGFVWVQSAKSIYVYLEDNNHEKK